MLTEIITTSFGDYVTNIAAESVLCQRVSSRGDEASKFAWASNLEFSRLAVTKELTIDQAHKVDGGVIKKISNGPTNPILVKETCDRVRKIKVQATLLMICDTLPEVSPADTLDTLVPFTCSSMPLLTVLSPKTLRLVVVKYSNYGTCTTR